MSEHDSFVPPATFEFLVMSLRTQAEVQLGLVHFGKEEERPRPQLPLARHAIDLLGMLAEKTKGNLSWDEQRMVENSLTELRFMFVQAADRLAKMPPAPAAESGESAAE